MGCRQGGQTFALWPKEPLRLMYLVRKESGWLSGGCHNRGPATKEALASNSWSYVVTPRVAGLAKQKSERGFFTSTTIPLDGVIPQFLGRFGRRWDAFLFFCVD